MNFLTSLLAFVLLATSAICQMPAKMMAQHAPIYGGVKVRLNAMSPVFAQTLLVDGTIVSNHDDGLVSAMQLLDDGEFAMTFYVRSDFPASIPQGPIGGDPVPVLTTSWCDEKGVTHTVTTPIVASTAGGIEKATKLHETLVQTMQAKHPPKQCPPPQPQPGGKVGSIYVIPRVIGQTLVA